MSGIELSGVTKRFGASTATSDVSLDVPSKAFFALPGPSDCGKTTLLRLIAGLERPDEGRIAVGDRPVAPGREVRGDKAPLATRPQQIQDRVDHGPQVRAMGTPSRPP